jgi:hypothetical protein
MPDVAYFSPQKAEFDSWVLSWEEKEQNWKTCIIELRHWIMYQSINQNFTNFGFYIVN